MSFCTIIVVIIVRIVFIGSFLFYCLLLNHSFQTNPNSVTNCFKLILSIYNFTITFAQCVRYFDFFTVTATIAYNAAASAVESALELLTQTKALYGDGITVSYSTGSSLCNSGGSNVASITFTQALGKVFKSEKERACIAYMEKHL